MGIRELRRKLERTLLTIVADAKSDRAADAALGELQRLRVTLEQQIAALEARKHPLHAINTQGIQ